MAADGGVVLGYLVPHPPNLLEADAAGEDLSTIRSLREIGREIRAADVDVILVASSHWQPEGPFFIDASEHHRHLTDYYGFSVEVRYECPGDPELAKGLMDSASKAGVFADCIWRRGMDHGVTVPMHFILPEGGTPVLPLSVSLRPLEECFLWGGAIDDFMKQAGKRAAFIASGAISHRLPLLSEPNAASRYTQAEKRIIEALVESDAASVLSLDAAVVEEAEPEAGLRDAMMLLGAVGEGAEVDVLAYEPFYGIGFATMRYVPAGKSG